MPRPPGAALFATGLFLLHATGSLYVFVDDEGITFVYARNLLDGLGLTCSVRAAPWFT